MNIYQRVVLVLGAIGLVIAFWTSPEYVKYKGVTYEVNKQPNINRKSKSAPVIASQRSLKQILMRSGTVAGATIFIFFALKGIKRKDQ